MKIQKIKIINILGLDEIEINPGEGTNIITAHNGAGKTSILEAIKLALGSGSDATVLRKGADKGQVVLMLDEDTVIRADVNSSGKVTRSITKDGIKSTQPISDIKEIADAIGINPVEFIANPKARLDIIVKCLGYEADTAAIKDVFGIDVPQGGIEVLDQVRKAIYDHRTGVNRSLKDKKATASTLVEAVKDSKKLEDIQLEVDKTRAALDEKNQEVISMTNAINSNFAEKEATIKQGLQAIEAEIKAKVGQIKSEYMLENAALLNKKETSLRNLKAEFDDAVAKLKAVYDTGVDMAREEYAKSILINQEAERARIDKVKAENPSNQAEIEKSLAELQAQRYTQIGQVNESSQEDIKALRDTLATLEEEKKRAIQARAVQDTVDQMRAEIDALSAESSKCSDDLKMIDQMKSDIFASIPITGLSVEDGVVMINGIPFDRVNTARQIEVAMQVALMRGSKLRAVCVDGIEALDSESMMNLMRWSDDNGVQVFVTKVSDEALKVESV